ncbi:Uma2 family endonuclease [Desulfobacterales bacterium HSG17]|nr:Uma2 family endonuclease [Desulfobacterales bacterium HSG17]
MNLQQLEKNIFTYADYRNWPEHERWEIINGTPYNMSPAPSVRHQIISGELFAQIHNLLSSKNCRVLAAPLDVRFPYGMKEDDKIIDVVQPDILIVCDPEKLDEKGCSGPPDFIAEIISPSTVSKDYITKQKLYEKNGVKEYWIIHPADNIIHVNILKKGTYRISIHEGKGKLKMYALPDLKIDLDKVFDA